MRTTVCTLFEKQYHFGLAVLANSLVRAGYAGSIHAGFRGPLPPWAAGRARQRDAASWELPVASGLRILFFHLETDAHFTNYKPEFMLQTLERTEAEAVLYVDPDLVFNTTWRFIEEWLTCGIALCDDVNSPVAENHPRRVGWRRFCENSGPELKFRGARYANGGLVGVSRQNVRLIEVWRDLLAAVAASLGGADFAGIGGGRTHTEPCGFADCFRLTDQDTLNAALEACREIPVSFLGRQAMGFEAGTPLLPHALGPLKPWSRNYLREALNGRPPARIDKIFWEFASGPLQPFTPGHVASIRWRLAVAAGMGRFMRRS